MLRNAIRLIVLALIVHAGVRIVPVFWHYVQFKDAVVELATYTGRRTPDQIKQRVAQLAEEHGVPIAAEDVTVTQENQITHVSTAWTAQLEYLPTRFYPYDLVVDVEGRPDRIGGLAP